jgi:hypothetical protein
VEKFDRLEVAVHEKTLPVGTYVVHEQISRAVQSGIAGARDFTHPTFTLRSDDFVGPEFVTRIDSHWLGQVKRFAELQPEPSRSQNR